MITKDLLDYFKKELVEYNFNFYDGLRDDKKEKSLTVYELGNLSETYFIGEQEFFTNDYQIQIVYGLSKSEAETVTKEIYKQYILENNYKNISNDIEFYMLPLQGRRPKYLGTLANGCHKYGIDVVVYSKK